MNDITNPGDHLNTELFVLLLYLIVQCGKLQPKFMTLLLKRNWIRSVYIHILIF